MLNNDRYAAMGGQPVPDSKNIRHDVLAQRAGCPCSYAFNELEEGLSKLESILSQLGPGFVALKTEPEIINVAIGMRRRWQTRTKEKVIGYLQNELSPRVVGAEPS